jgi:hypothetical protein
MARKKQSVDIDVLDRIKKIKNLERTLIDGNVPSLDVNSLNLLKERGFNDEEIEDFVRKYSEFAGDYLLAIVPSVISRGFQTLYDENRKVLKGMPEGEYLRKLIGYQEGNENHNIKIEDLELSIRTANCLRNDNIRYFGQLVQIKETEMLRIPNFGRKGLNELKEILSKHGLRFGMEINYVSPEERDKEVK